MIEWIHVSCVQHARSPTPRSTQRHILCFPPKRVALWILHLTSKEMVSVVSGLICYSVPFQDQSVQRANRFQLTSHSDF